MRVSVLDLGSNSFRLLVADVEPNGAIRPLLRERELLHLGGDVAASGTISPVAAERAVAAVQHLTDLALRTGADRSIVVATSAIRDAANRAEVVDRLTTAAGSPVRVLSGEEEARLGFLGVAASVALPDGPHLVLDLGGGSLELTVGQGLSVEWSASVDLGVSRLHAELARSDPLATSDVAAIRRRIEDALRPLAGQVASNRPVATVLVGGPHRSIAQLIGARHLSWQPPTLNQLVIPAAEIHALGQELVELDIDGRRGVPGMKESRVAEMSTAALIVSTTLGLLDVEEATVSYWGLREGTILDAFGITELPLGLALRPASVDRMAARFSRHGDHDAHVERLAFSLFDQLGNTHGLDPSARELLGYAARLHTIGMSVSFKGFHRHGAYLIEHSELRGFDPHEIAMLASLVRFQRRGTTKGSYEPFAALHATDQQVIARLAPMLSLADALDRSLDQAVSAVRIEPIAGGVRAVLEGAAELRRDWVESAVAAFAEGLGLTLELSGAAIVETV